MYLPTNGANRDRTAVLMSFRGTSVKARSSRETNDTSHLLSRSGLNECEESPLEPFFHLAAEIKGELVRINTSFDALLRKHQECLRPTFTDTSDSINEINVLTNSINSHLQTITQKINYINMNDPAHPDRLKVLANLRSALLESFREFSVKFKMAQQTFSASFNKAPHMRKKKKKKNSNEESFDDFLSFNIGDEQSERRQQQLQEERNNEEIEQIARRAEEIRNIFMDLSNLIIDQGTIIDRIDFCVNESLNNAREAHKDVEKAAKYQGKSRMWICAMILAVMVVILIIMALLK